MTDSYKDDFRVLGPEPEKQNLIAARQTTWLGYAWRRFRQNRVAVGAAVLLILIALMTTAGPEISGYDISQSASMSERNQAPSKAHWFGTDDLGRDLFTRVAAGGRVSMRIALAGALIVMIAGSLYGGAAALQGGRTDAIMMRIVDVLSSVPHILVVILISVMTDSQSIGTLLLAMTITGWCPTARLVRSEMLKISQSEYVLAAKLMGIGRWEIILRHLIPNSISIIIVDATFRIPGFIFSEAFLSYVGLGIQPPQTSWGALAASAQSMYQFYPWQLFFPALMIALTMLGFTLLGDGLRDALDPRQRK